MFLRRVAPQYLFIFILICTITSQGLVPMQDSISFDPNGFPIFPETVIKTKSSTSPYATSKNAFYASDPNLRGQCTWYAYGRVVELAEAGYLDSSAATIMYNAFWGKSQRDAKNWPSFLGGTWTATTSAPLPIDKRKPGMLAVWIAGTNGHVGFVEEVSADKTKYRLSDFNRGLDEIYRSVWYNYEGTSDYLLGTYPSFYQLPLPATTSSTYQGYHDGANCDKIYGWAWRSDQPNTPINVDIYVDGVKYASGVPANEYRVDIPGNHYHAFNYFTPGLFKDGITRSISVKFSDTGGNLSNTPKDLVSSTCFASTPPPTPVSPGTGTEPGTTISTTTPTFQWNGTSGATSYGLYISKYPYGSGNIVYSNTNLTGTSFPLPSGNLVNGEKYRWNMTAFYPSGESLVSNTLYFNVSTVTTTAPSPPTASSPGSNSEPGAEISTTTPTFQWSNVSNATRYSLFISKYPYGASNIVYSNTNLTGTSLPLPSGNLVNGEKYRWNMTASNSAGESNVSNTLYFSVNVPVTSQNPSAQQISDYADQLSSSYKVPSVIIKALLEQESGWRQFNTDGSPVTHTEPDGRIGIGLTQVTVQNTSTVSITLGTIQEGTQQGSNPFTTGTQSVSVDVNRLKTDWQYNMDVGVRVLVAKKVVSGGAPDDAGILENWYYPLAYYNGAAKGGANDPNNSTYSRSVSTSSDWKSVSKFPYQECIFNIIAQLYPIPSARSSYYGPAIKVTLPGPSSVASGAGQYNYVEPVFCFYDWAVYFSDGTVHTGNWGSQNNGCISEQRTRTNITVHKVQFGAPSSSPQTPAAPTVVSPGTSSEPGETLSTTTPTFQWSGSSGATRYGLYISKYPYGASNIVYSNTNLTGTSFPLPSGNLVNGEKYRWNMTAFNSTGESDVSNTLYFNVSLVPTTRTLTVASSNPGSGVSVTISPNDNNSQGNGTTQFTRTYNNNASVNLTAPMTSGGNNFQKWLRDGQELSTNPSTGVTMDADHTLTAVYVTPVLTPPTVSTGAASSITSNSAVISGSVNPNGSATNYWFEYGQSSSLASFLSTGTQSAGSGNAGVSVSAGLGSLTPGTPYYYRVAASNNGGTTKGSILSFTTTTPCPSVAGLNPSSGLAGSSVVISGSDLTGVSAVRFFNNVAATFTVNSSTQITATVPNGAVAGPITLVKSGCADAQTGSFTVAQSATITSPANGSTFNSSTVNFSWGGGVGVSDYQIFVGNAPSAFDIYMGPVTSGTTATVNGLPTDGRLLHVTLWSKINGAWQQKNYTYTAYTESPPQPAEMTSPVNGSVLTTSTVTFNWTIGNRVTDYQLWIGSSPSARNLYTGPVTKGTTAAVSGLPISGADLYVTLWSMIDGKWQSRSYTYKTSCQQFAEMTSPANGSTLNSTAATFNWSSSACATAYQLWVGTKPRDAINSPATYDLYQGPVTAGNTANVSGLPADGRAIYATLWSKVNGTWQAKDYLYKAWICPPAEILSPANGATLSSVATFNWSSVSCASVYQLWIGSSPSSHNIFYGDVTSGTTATVQPTQADGRTLYVTLWSKIGAEWYSRAYTYTAPSSPAEISSPVNGSTLASTSVTFNWNSVPTASAYQLWVGNKPRDASNSPTAYDIFYGDVTSGTTATVIKLPSDGRKVYATLWTKFGSGWLSKDYVYNAFDCIAAAEVTSPVDKSTFTSSAVTFKWNVSPCAARNQLWVGNKPATSDIFYADVSGGSTAVNGLPVDGRPLYVTLWSFINGTWRSKEYTYTAYLQIAEITSPRHLATFSSSDVKFDWSLSPTATDYYLYVGNSLRSYDIFSQYVFGGTTTVSGIPFDGRIIYVTIWSKIDGKWLGNDYRYTACPSCGGPGVVARMTDPVYGTVFKSATRTFTWDTGTNATGYWLFVGSTPGAYDIFSADLGLATSKTITTLPTDGRTIYLTLFSMINGEWHSNQYVYTAVNVAKAKMISPPGGTALTSSTATFTWDAGSGVTGYSLFIGSTPGTYDLYSADTGTGLSKTVNGLPMDGRTLYVTLWSRINGDWQGNEYTYTAGK
jgi:hypothetical protein